MPNSVLPYRRQPTRLLCPWGSQGKSTGMGCHFLLQCVKVKSESEVAQSCPTLTNPMDCSPPGSSVHGIFQARVLEWGAIAFSGLWTRSLLTMVGVLSHAWVLMEKSELAWFCSTNLIIEQVLLRGKKRSGNTQVLVQISA